jgi:hypothetical protein
VWLDAILCLSLGGGTPAPPPHLSAAVPYGQSSFGSPGWLAISPPRGHVNLVVRGEGGRALVGGEQAHLSRCIRAANKEALLKEGQSEPQQDRLTGKDVGCSEGPPGYEDGRAGAAPHFHFQGSPSGPGVFLPAVACTEGQGCSGMATRTPQRQCHPGQSDDYAVEAG